MLIGACVCCVVDGVFCLYHATCSVHVYRIDQSCRDKAKEETRPENSCPFRGKNEGCPRRDANQCHTCTVQVLYQLSHQGSPAGQAESLRLMQGLRHLFPARQGFSKVTYNGTYGVILRIVRAGYHPVAIAQVVEH